MLLEVETGKEAEAVRLHALAHLPQAHRHSVSKEEPLGCQATLDPCLDHPEHNQERPISRHYVDWQSQRNCKFKTTRGYIMELYQNETMKYPPQPPRRQMCGCESNAWRPHVLLAEPGGATLHPGPAAQSCSQLTALTNPDKVTEHGEHQAIWSEATNAPKCVSQGWLPNTPGPGRLRPTASTLSSATFRNHGA